VTPWDSDFDPEPLEPGELETAEDAVDELDRLTDLENGDA